MNYSIGQVAEKFDLSIHTLRYYEKEGLLPTVKRTDSGIRKFDDITVEALRVIECLKKTGMPLKEIRQFMEWAQEGDSSLEERQALFHERKQSVLDQIAELQSVLDLINFKCWYYDTARELGSEKAVINMDRDKIPEEIKDLYSKTHS